MTQQRSHHAADNQHSLQACSVKPCERIQAQNKAHQGSLAGDESLHQEAQEGHHGQAGVLHLLHLQEGHSTSTARTKVWGCTGEQELC